MFEMDNMLQQTGHVNEVLQSFGTTLRVELLSYGVRRKAALNG